MKFLMILGCGLPTKGYMKFLMIFSSGHSAKMNVNFLHIVKQLKKTVHLSSIKSWLSCKLLKLFIRSPFESFLYPVIPMSRYKNKMKRGWNQSKTINTFFPSTAFADWKEHHKERIISKWREVSRKMTLLRVIANNLTKIMYDNVVKWVNENRAHFVMFKR